MSPDKFDKWALKSKKLDSIQFLPHANETERERDKANTNEIIMQRGRFTWKLAPKSTSNGKIYYHFLLNNCICYYITQWIISGNVI